MHIDQEHVHLKRWVFVPFVKSTRKIFDYEFFASKNPPIYISECTHMSIFWCFPPKTLQFIFRSKIAENLRLFDTLPVGNAAEVQTMNWSS